MEELKVGDEFEVIKETYHLQLGDIYHIYHIDDCWYDLQGGRRAHALSLRIEDLYKYFKKVKKLESLDEIKTS